MANIVSIGQTALNAAQIGLATAGHNIANASTPGYSRQVVVQDALGGQDMGGGFVGKGTQVVAVRRVYNEFLQDQMVSAQTSQGRLQAYHGQIRLIDNMLADPTVGVSPALQDFFGGLQSLSADPNSAAARQSMLSAAHSLVSRFQTLDSQLVEISEGVNAEIRSSMASINVTARQIASLNDQIERATRNSNGQQPNDLLDQRDRAIMELSREVKVTVVKQSSSYDVYIGNGQPLVINSRGYDLVPMQSLTDSGRIQIGYVSRQGTVMLAEDMFAGGRLAGLFDFRSQSLDVARNALGRMAIVLGDAFNRQHMLGQDQAGAPGVKFFNVAQPLITASTTNTGTGSVAATINDAALLTNSNYKVKINQVGVPPDFTVTRLSDGLAFSGSPVDGIDLSFNGDLQAGDEFLLRPTVNGASANLGLAVAISDIGRIAAAAPIRTMASDQNSGSGRISAGTVDATPALDPDLRSPVTIRFTSPTTYTVTGAAAGLPAPGDNFTYTPGADISYNGWRVQISGAPQASDSFSIGANTGGVGDARNATLLAGLQTATLLEGRSSLQGAYSEMVSLIGNKTRELAVTSSAADKLAQLTISAREAESGVNLDEEAADLLRYQQAYQAAGKVMKTANELFQLLLSLG